MKIMFKISSIFVLILVINIVYSCKKDEPLPPRITTTSVTVISATTAVSGGILTDVGSTPLLKIGLCWSTSPEPTIADQLTTESLVDLSFTSNLTQLTPNTNYYVRAYATNSNGTGYGNQISFTTSQIPKLTTTEITHLSSTTATTGGNITIDNATHVTAKGVCWGTGPSPTIDDSKTIDGSGTGSFVSIITGLKKGTLYYVRAYATSDDGTFYGNELTFQTTDEIILTKENCILSGGSIISTYDGGHIVFGYIYKDDIPPYQIVYWIPYLIKLDADGNRVWETEVSVNIANTSGFQRSNVLETKDHKIVFCYRSYVVMLDENGNLLWKFDYKTDERYICSSLIESDENNLFVLSSNELRTLLLKVSLDGKLLSDKLVKDGDDVNYNCGYLLCKLDNGNYFLSGYSNINLQWRIWVAEINSVGDIKWEKNYIDTYESSRCTDMVNTQDGGIIITGSSMGNSNITYARVLKLDSNHELTWEKSFSWDNFKNNINAIIQDSNGDYVFCGTQGYQKVRAILVKLNKDGGEIWKRTYWPEGEIDFMWYLGSLLQISNGGYMLVGNQRTLWGEAMPKGIWIKKVDQSGY